jgi:hypothetical protein
MNKYKEALCCKCMGAILVPEHESDDFYCNTCAWAKVGGVRIPYTSDGGSS